MPSESPQADKQQRRFWRSTVDVTDASLLWGHTPRGAAAVQRAGGSGVSARALHHARLRAGASSGQSSGGWLLCRRQRRVDAR